MERVKNSDLEQNIDARIYTNFMPESEGTSNGLIIDA
jgi:hypothetical protein